MKFVDALGTPYQPTKFLTFDDILLLPQKSDVVSRKDPSTKSHLTPNKELDIPIVASPMDTVCEGNMALAMDKLGGAGIIHRFFPSENHWADNIHWIDESGNERCVNISCGLGKEWLAKLNRIVEEVNVASITVDVAHGHLAIALDFIKELRSKFPDVDIISGSIATYEAAIDNIKAGATGLRVGVGPGSACTTRRVTGVGVSQLSAIMSVRRAILDASSDATLIADGGVRNSGDGIKCLAAGADCLMLGRLLAGTNESPSQYFPDTNNKIYRGQASSSFMEAINKTDITPEGESMFVPYLGNVSDVIADFMGGIRSGMSYCGASSLEELRSNAVAIEVGHNTYIEGGAHGKH